MAREGLRESIPRDLWVRFFAVHSQAVRAPETETRLRLDVEAGQPAGAAIVGLRGDSMSAAGIDPALGMALLQKLPLLCSNVSVRRSSARGIASAAQSGLLEDRNESGGGEGDLELVTSRQEVSSGVATLEPRNAKGVQTPGSCSSPVASSAGESAEQDSEVGCDIPGRSVGATGPVGVEVGQGVEGGASGGEEALANEPGPDLEIVLAICRMNAEEDMLMDALCLTPLVFAQKKMQGQIVAQQQAAFLSEFTELEDEEQLKCLEKGRGSMEKERGRLKWRAARSSGEDALSGREIWELLAAQLSTGQG